MLKFAHDIAGGAGNLIIVSFQSPGFEAGVSGWQVTRTGDAEFNNIIARGVIDATEFSATVVVSAGSYAGTYTIETGEYTDPDDNQLAVIQWLNGTSPAVIPPYLAGVNGEGAGAIASLHSGQQDDGDSDASVWVESAGASSTGQSLVLFSAATWQPFGATGPTLFQNGAGWAADTWHPVTFQNGWKNATSPAVTCQYRLTAENEVEVIGTPNGADASAAAFATLPAGYRPAHQQMVPCQNTDSTSGNYYVQCSTGGVLSVEGTEDTGPFTFHGFISLDA